MDLKQRKPPCRFSLNSQLLERSPSRIFFGASELNEGRGTASYLSSVLDSNTELNTLVDMLYKFPDGFFTYPFMYYPTGDEFWYCNPASGDDQPGDILPPMCLSERLEESISHLISTYQSRRERKIRPISGFGEDLARTLFTVENV